MTDAPRTHICNGVRIAPIVAFGHTWLRQDELAAAAGAPLRVFRNYAIDARLYGAQPERMIKLDDGSLALMYSVDAALQLALYLRACRGGDNALRAANLIRLLCALRCAGFDCEQAAA